MLSHPYMNRIRDILHRGDRAMIYIFIAASYYPWLTLVPNVHEESKSSSSILSTILSWLGISSIVAADLRWTVWFLAAMGILYQHIFHEKYKWLETLFYIAIGLIPALPFLHKVIFCKAIFHWDQFSRFFLFFVSQDEIPGLWELKLGGACYMVGIIFFKCDGRIPLAHAIWHIHVAMGASIQYYAVFSYLFG